MKFEDIVRKMSAKELILAMVEGLEKPAVEVEMRSFGYSNDNGVCFGCAATNTICKIRGTPFNSHEISRRYNRAAALNTFYSFLADFESAINALRLGDIDYYNELAEDNNFAKIVQPVGLVLPVLETENYRDGLPAYRKLAEAQP